MTTLGQRGRFGLLIGLFLITLLGISLRAGAAPYAAYVVDARSGEVLHSSNADARLHPASLTKMMTLYIAFQAVEHGELSLDTEILISKKAAAEPPSKLGLKAGTRVPLRYLIRAAAVKSANDAATAIGEGIEGSEAAFARRMNRTAQALGMTRTTFKNAHGLTEDGHLSTARDMTNLGRHLFYDYPEYYNLFSRQSTDAGGKTVLSSNRRFLSSYKGADGIKTGYTRAAGFNLVASAERGSERIIATVFGGASTAARNAKVAELLDLGFRRAPTKVALRKPAKPAYSRSGDAPVAMAALEADTPAPDNGSGIYKGKTVRVSGLVQASLRPRLRPGSEAPEPPAVEVSEELLVALAEEIDNAVKEVAGEEADVEVPVVLASAAPEVSPVARPRFLTEPASEDLSEDEAIPGSAGDLQVAVAPEPEGFSATGGPALAKALMPKARPVRSVQVEAEPVLLASAEAAPAPAPQRQPQGQPQPQAAEEEQVVVTRVSTSGSRHWGISLGKYPSRYKAERVLLKTALTEMQTLDGSLRKVNNRSGGFEATFLGLSAEQARLACARLAARGTECATMEPGSNG